MDEQLAGQDRETDASEPVGPSTLALAQRLAVLDSRHRLSAAFLWTAILFTFTILMLVAYLAVHRPNARLDDLNARQVATSVEQARINGAQRNSICLTIQSLRATYSKPGREAYPGGTGRYDALFAQLAQASGALNCDAG